MNHRSWDVLVTAALAAAAMGVTLLGWQSVPGLGLLGTALTLVLPGFVLSLVFLPRLALEERVLCALSLSLVIDILGGLLLQVTPWGLRSSSWVVLLGGLTLACSLAVWFRRRGLAAEAVAWTWPKVGLLPVIGFGAAFVILSLAVGLAAYGAQQTNDSFTQLWAVPTRSANLFSVQIGARNQENRPESYRLLVASGDLHIKEWQRIDLGSNESWTARLIWPAKPRQLVDVFLYRLDQPDQVYRMVRISPDSFALAPN